MTCITAAILKSTSLLLHSTAAMLKHNIPFLSVTMQVTISALLVAAVLGFSHGASVMRIEPSEPLEQVVKAKPVNLTIYYESKCESCGYFIVDQVGPVWKKLEDSGIFSVYFIPYGNAQVEHSLCNMPKWVG